MWGSMPLKLEYSWKRFMTVQKDWWEDLLVYTLSLLSCLMEPKIMDRNLRERTGCHKPLLRQSWDFWCQIPFHSHDIAFSGMMTQMLIYHMPKIGFQRPIPQKGVLPRAWQTLSSGPSSALICCAVFGMSLPLWAPGSSSETESIEFKSIMSLRHNIPKT